MKNLSRISSLFALSIFWNLPIASAQGLPTASPEEVGLSSERLKRIGAVMQSYVDQGKLAGLITMVARRGKVVHFERFGMMDREAGKPIWADTIFRIYSMTKPITSAAIMMLYEEGHFQLDDPVSKFIPEFGKMRVFTYASADGSNIVTTAPEREATIRDLLRHTSGLTYGSSKEPVDVMYNEAKVIDYDTTLKEMVRKLGTLPLRNHPGREWHYSVSMDVLGYLVEVISGMAFDAFLEKRIFKPLGMKDTNFYVPKEKHSRFAATYGPDGEGGIKLIDPPASSRFAKPVKLLSGGGGLVSTASDYMRFLQMLLNGGELDGVRLLGTKTVELMTANHLPEEMIPILGGTRAFKGYGFGLGVRVMVHVSQAEVLGSKGEYGWIGAASTYFLIDPKEEMIGIVMTQFRPNNFYPIHRQFKVLTYQAIVD